MPIRHEIKINIFVGARESKASRKLLRSALLKLAMPLLTLDDLDRIGLGVVCSVCQDPICIANTVCPRNECRVYMCAPCAASSSHPTLTDKLKAMENDRPPPGDKAVRCTMCRQPNPEGWCAYPADVIMTNVLECKHGCGYTIQIPVSSELNHPDKVRVRAALDEHERQCLEQPGAKEVARLLALHYGPELAALETENVRTNSVNDEMERELHEARNDVAELTRVGAVKARELELFIRQYQAARSDSEKAEGENDRLVAENKRLREANKSLRAEKRKRARTETSGEASAAVVTP